MHLRGQLRKVTKRGRRRVARRFLYIRNARDERSSKTSFLMGLVMGAWSSGSAKLGYFWVLRGLFWPLRRKYIENRGLGSIKPRP